MARSKLKLLTDEVNHYLGLPYARNVWQNNKLAKEAIFGGKGHWTDIEYATRCAAEIDKVDLGSLTPRQIYNLQKRHHIGIDCSGLTYQLADYWDKINGRWGILFKVTSSQTDLGKYGPRALSAYQLCQPHNSQPVDSLKDVRTGDFILLDGGKHIIFVIENQISKIIYVNSSTHTATRPVHLGQIIIKDPGLPLANQLFSDITLEGQPYTTIFHPNQGDGIYRLNCF